MAGPLARPAVTGTVTGKHQPGGNPHVRIHVTYWFARGHFEAFANPKDQFKLNSKT